MYLNDTIQETLRQLNKIAESEVVKKQGDLYVAVNVLTGASRIMNEEQNLIESLSNTKGKSEKKILKG